MKMFAAGALSTLLGVVLLSAVKDLGQARAEDAVPPAATPAAKETWESKIRNGGSFNQGNVIGMRLEILVEGEDRDRLTSELVQYLSNPLNGQERLPGEEFIRKRDYAAMAFVVLVPDLKYSVPIGELLHERDTRIRDIVTSYHEKVIEGITK
ncbi:hypothetical protein [Haloferula sp. BvORR071]|uniref:hypothetical protein n=1 Tax=Haloferula sp. BvORR071 TaxID=1396141 RepID=UPI0005545A38|nr:hypothetical protein [Haloferula sp. BvORR071]